jgi:hemoglobin
MKINFYQNLFGWMLLAGLALSTSCKDDDKKEASLYDRLGKVEAISAVVDQFLGNVVADNRINGKFSATVASAAKVQALRDNLIDQICQASGGPCVYEGKSMVAAHTGMNITINEFNALVEDLVDALDEFDVPEKEKNELLATLGPLQTDIVGK